ncbi:MAG: hypothetical protein E7327_08835 [Clostridiales bacterium]|nr:hypothetical protein [Clostridiales bacterium]
MSMDEIRVRLPRVLDATGSSLRERGRLHPIGPVSITLNIAPLHRVILTLAENDLPLAIHDLVEVYNQNGSVGVYRVKHIGDTKRKERQIELAHGLDTLSDAHIAVIENYKGNVEGMLRKILAAQKQPLGGVIPWVLGVCEDPNPWKKEIKYDNALECLTDIAKTEEDYMFTFDMSVFPWVLNFVRRDSTVMSEWRMNRNVDQCQISWDDGDQCTRLYLSVTDEDSETVKDKDNQNHTIVTVSEGYYTFDDAEGQADWGIVETPAGVDRASVPTQAALDAWVAGYFARHRQPALQIQIDGQEYVRITGERLDEAHMGRISRVTMPEYKSVFNERLVSVTYPDALRKPTLIRLSLANKRQTSEGSFAEIRQKASRASSGASSARATAQNAAAEIEKQKIRYDLRVEQDDRHWAVIASEEWFEEMASGQMTLVGKYDANLEVTARKIGAALSVTGVKLDSNGMPVKNGDDYVFDGSNNTLSAQISAQAEQIRAKVSSSDVKNQIEAYGYLQINSLSTEMGNVLTGANGATHAATIATKINNSSGSSLVKISADHIDINGNTRIGGLLGIDGNDVVVVGGGVYSEQGFRTVGNSKFEGNLVIEDADLDLINGAVLKFGGVAANPVDSISDGTTNAEGLTTFTYTRWDGTTTGTFSFNQAATSFYKAGVAAGKTAASNETANSIAVGTPTEIIRKTRFNVPVTVTKTDYTVTPNTTTELTAYVSGNYPGLSSSDSSIQSATQIPATAISTYTVYPYVTIEGDTSVTFFGNPINLDTSRVYQAGQNQGGGSVTLTMADEEAVYVAGVSASVNVTGTMNNGATAQGHPVRVTGLTVDTSTYADGVYTLKPSFTMGGANHTKVINWATSTLNITEKLTAAKNTGWDAAANVIEATNGGITIPLEGAYGDNPNTTKLNLYLKQDANWSSEYKKNVYIRDVDNISANQGTTIATLEVDASGLVGTAQTAAKNAVKITGPTWATTPASGISVSSNTATFSTDAPTPQSKSLVVNLASGSWGPVTGSTNKQINVYATHTNSNASNRIAATTITANLYSPGTITPTTSEQTIALPAGYIGFAGPLTVAAASGGSTANIESSHSHTMETNSETVTPSTGYDAMAEVTVDASGRYYAGKAAVVLSDTLSWATTPSSSITANQNTVTISTSGRTDTSGNASEKTKAINLYSNATTSGLTATFYVTHTNSLDANRIIKRTATCSDSNLTAANIKSGVSIFGVTGTYEGSGGKTISEIGLYYDTAKAEEVPNPITVDSTLYLYPIVTFSDDTTQVGSRLKLLPSGESYTIIEKPDTITANGTYYASSDDVDGWSKVVVNVPTSGGGSHNIAISGAAQSDTGKKDTSVYTVVFSGIQKGRWYTFQATCNGGNGKWYQFYVPT